MPGNNTEIEKRLWDAAQTHITNLYQLNCSLVNQHVYDSYSSAGKVKHPDVSHWSQHAFFV